MIGTRLVSMLVILGQTTTVPLPWDKFYYGGAASIVVALIISGYLVPKTLVTWLHDEVVVLRAERDAANVKYEAAMQANIAIRKEIHEQVVPMLVRVGDSLVRKGGGPGVGFP